MSEERKASHGDKTVQVIAGQYHKFMLIPIMDHHADFFPCGPITFGIEGRGDLAAEGAAWMARWKDLHPQFNTVDY
jgi:hypothetical protein